MKIAGVVLAGGKSSRYGKPKMFEIYKNKFFYEYSVEALKQNSISPVVISTNEKLTSFFDRNDVEFVIEKETDAFKGPLFAMYHAFSTISNADWFFVLASDIPFVTADFVKMMIDNAYGTSYDAIIPMHSNTIQPLFGLYHRRILVKMEQLLATNNRKLKLLLSDINIKTIPFSTNERIFTNINYPEDWLGYND